MEYYVGDIVPYVNDSGEQCYWLCTDVYEDNYILYKGLTTDHIEHKDIAAAESVITVSIGPICQEFYLNTYNTMPENAYKYPLCNIHSHDPYRRYSF